MGGSVTPIPPVSSVTSSWSDRTVVTRTYDAGEGQIRVKHDVYNVTVYDSNGHKQSVTNSHTVDYLV